MEYWMDLITTNKPVTIDLIGDPMVDIWQSPTEWYVTPGGAFNVYKNIESLIETYPIELRSCFYLLTLGLLPLREAQECGYPVKQYDCDKKWNVIKTEDYPSVYHPINSDTCVYKQLDQLNNYSILVVSDYNKGFVTKHLKEHLNSKRYNICIVDSRYANTNFDLLRGYCDILIWRKTSTDEEADFNWDYKIESNGSESTTIIISKFYKGIEQIYNIGIEDIRPTVCATGCGDTFTATIAVTLGVKAIENNFRLPKLQDIIDSVYNGHIACQDVVSRPRTSIAKNFQLV